MEITTVSAEFGGQTLTIETGRMARLAGGAVTVRYGDTVVLGTANRSDPRPGLDFFPLTIEFEERMYAAGKIPGGYIKREGKASENATLSARLTDRPIRPLFPEGYKDDVQVVITVLSADQENDPDILGTIAASAALTISEIPFLGPIGAVRVGLVDDKFILNPTFEQLETSDLDLVVSGTADAIMMVEAGANLINEAKMAEAIEFGHDAIKALISLQEQLRAKVGKAKRVPYIEPGVDSVLTFAEAAANGAVFVVVDTETTGLDAKLSDLVEVAAVKIKGGKITDRWSTLVNAGNPIVGAQMHGITTADLKKGAAPKEAAEKFADFAKGAIVVGHNLGFDVSFLDEALGKGRSIELLVGHEKPPLRIDRNRHERRRVAGARRIGLGQVKPQAAAHQRCGDDEDHQQHQHHIDQRRHVDVAHRPRTAAALEASEGHAVQSREEEESRWVCISRRSWAKPSSSVSQAVTSLPKML